MIAHGKRFHDTTIYLDGCTFEGCTFERCTLVFSGMIGEQLKQNVFTDCRWEMSGPAANSIGFLTAIYAQGGGKDLVEKTFYNIRANATGQRRAGDTVVLN